MIREAIIKGIKDKDISIRKCAIDNEFTYQHFSEFLKYKRPFPVKNIENVLNYLDLEICKKQ